MVGPAEGHVVCGTETERGRMVEPDEIFAAIAVLVPPEQEK